MIEIIRKGMAHIECLINLKHIGKHSYILNPIRIVGGRSVSIGDYSGIMDGARIEAISEYGGVQFWPSIYIGNHVDIGQFVHITAASNLTIGDGTSILPNVLITDIDHKIESVDIPPANQPIIVRPVSIGKNCLIGMGTRILPGVTVGDGCVIGANAVLTHSIPEYSMAVGIPAKIIKKYNFTNNGWESIRDNES